MPNAASPWITSRSTGWVQRFTSDLIDAARPGPHSRRGPLVRRRDLKTEPSYDDMTIKPRRVIVAARFRGPCPEQASPARNPGRARRLGRRRHMINQNCETQGVVWVPRTLSRHVPGGTRVRGPPTRPGRSARMAAPDRDGQPAGRLKLRVRANDSVLGTHNHSGAGSIRRPSQRWLKRADQKTVSGCSACTRSAAATALLSSEAMARFLALPARSVCRRRIPH